VGLSDRKPAYSTAGSEKREQRNKKAIRHKSTSQRLHLADSRPSSRGAGKGGDSSRTTGVVVADPGVVVAPAVVVCFASSDGTGIICMLG